MAKASLNLQDSFLNQVRKENSEVKILLLNGHELTGLVRGFDNFTVVLSVKGQQHLIYKHAIAQIIIKRRTGKEDLPESEAPAQKKASGFNTIDVAAIKIDE
ncbi:RNA chaperone Hfq [Candidatus Sumerlaeota bacterium]|nr:RNA chaperone Hfq [Candidatus Sumerlaeota bacterium]